MAIELDPRHRRITTTVGGGCLLLIGLVFAGMGSLFIFLLLTGADGVTVGDRPGRAADAWKPGIFVLLGAVMGLSRYRKEVDLATGRLTRTFRCVIPLWRRERELGPPVKVTLSKEVRRGSQNSHTVYPVHLVAGEDPIELSSDPNERTARAEAERVARFVELPLEDSSAGSVLVRTHDSLDRSVIETAELDGQPIEAPPASVLVVAESGRGLEVRIPLARGPLLLGAGGIATVLLVSVGFWWFAWRPGVGEVHGLFDRLFSYAPLLMAGVPVIGGIFMGIHRGLFGSVVEVDPRGVRARTLLGSTWIAVDDLEELRVVGGGLGPHLLARSDEREFRCGHGLSEADRRYLRALLLRQLGARTRA